MDKYKNLTNAINIAIFVLSALLSGFGSAWMILENGSALTSTIDGQWRSWRTAGRVDADPYARAHLSRSGRLPLSSANVQYFLARTDEDGLRLLGICEYAIENTEIVSDWWSLTAFDDAGNLLKNSAGRYAFNSSTILRDTTGKYKVSLAAAPRSGNWLPTDIDKKITLLFRLHKPVNDEIGQTVKDTRRHLPSIRRVRCG